MHFELFRKLARALKSYSVSQALVSFSDFCNFENKIKTDDSQKKTRLRTLSKLSFVLK